MPQRLLIIGPSKSGTTALLNSLSEALGGAQQVFEPSDLRLVDLEDAPVVVKKLLGSFQGVEAEAFGGFDGRIFINRDPRDRLVSWLLYDVYGRKIALDPEKSRIWIDMIRAKEADPAGVPFFELTYRYWELTQINLINAFANTNDRIVRFWKRHGDAFELLRYESLVSGRTQSFESRLGLPRLSRAEVSGAEARVTRTKGSGAWHQWFTPADVAVLRPFCAEIMRTFGYPGEWEPEPSPTLDPSTGSAYVERLVAQRRDEEAAAEEARRAAQAQTDSAE